MESCRTRYGPVKQVKNRSLVPDMKCEGTLSKEIFVTTDDKLNSSPFERLFSHHTLASIRRLGFFHPFNIPKDSLDIILLSTYNHTTETFADREDIFIQPETRGCLTWRRLRNTRDIYPPLPDEMGHPLRRGGVTERISPHTVKLMNSGVHSSQTNPGYSRKAAGGAIFFY